MGSCRTTPLRASTGRTVAGGLTPMGQEVTPRIQGRWSSPSTAIRKSCDSQASPTRAHVSPLPHSPTHPDVRPLKTTEVIAVTAPKPHRGHVRAEGGYTVVSSPPVQSVGGQEARSRERQLLPGESYLPQPGLLTSELSPSTRPASVLSPSSALGFLLFLVYSSEGPRFHLSMEHFTGKTHPHLHKGLCQAL